MSRSQFLKLLEEYSPLDEADRNTKERFLDFVRSEPQCFQRSLVVGHVTGSAFLVDKEEKRLLLTHHKKLGKWLQLGGHADGEEDILGVALREAEEESGLQMIQPISPAIFDLDIHPIPARRDEAEHLHYDARFCFKYLGDADFRVSEESHSLAWIELEQLERFTTEYSLLRMRGKFLSR